MSNFSDTIGAQIEAAVKRGTEGKDVAVAFSGGLDSGLVAAFVKKYARSAVLYTAGTEDAYDMRMAEQMSEDLGMEWVRIPITGENLEDHIRTMMKATGTVNALTLSFETPLFYVCTNCKEDIVIGGQGSDEIFAGYSKYVGLDNETLSIKMKEDLAKLTGPVLAHEDRVADHFGKTILYPFLDPDVIKSVGEVDIGILKPKNAETRKSVLKEIASEMGYPFVAEKKKKAAQYGSGMIDLVHEICKSKGITFGEWVDIIAEEEGL
ncbi:MAG: asparagine synthase [Candidatus Methanoplasma sp.]|jgi:asparagine synthase (glutamine-hydrolysing)|nr:asparagine synthase [Candidatus Methanoplasma sp.]